MGAWTAIAPAAIGLAALGMLILAALSGWRGWLDLRRFEARERRPAQESALDRIEMADVKERLRQLEMIAAGIDL